MGRVIVFPAHSTVRPPTVEGASPVTAPSASRGAARPGILSRIFSIAWIFFLLTWPLAQWVVAFDIVYEFLRALYYWNTPGVYAGFTFVIHLIAGSALTYLVATRQIK